jgi:predicted phosphodiesterase
MKKILVVGDMHVGSKVSLMTNEVKLESGNVIKANPIQNLIYSKWAEMVEEVGTVDATIVLGDTIDGPDVKGKGAGMWTTNLHTQVRVASLLLSMIDSKKYLGVQGSNYHVGDNLSADGAVMSDLGGVFGDELSVAVDSSRIHVSHSVGVSSAGSSYRPTPIAREMMLAAINKEEYGGFNLILRGHAHYYVRVSFASTTGLICPCWKGRDSFVARRTLAFMPHLGYILLYIKGKEIEIEPHIFVLKEQNLMKEVKV